MWRSRSVLTTSHCSRAICSSFHVCSRLYALLCSLSSWRTLQVIDLDQFAASWEEIRREIQAMSLCGHRNVVRMLASFVEGQDLWIVMPLMNAGSCAHIMKAIYPTGFKDESLVATILREVLLGLLYFHNDGRLHRDLKAANILVSNEGEVQLSDMGVAATLMENGDRKRMRTTFTGTPCWMVRNKGQE